jgi:vacuolar-type H+-ATPase subunit D/Vma8
MKLKYIFCVCGIFMLMACAQPPVAEMDSARESVLRAENDPDAVKYGISSLTRAQNSLSSMQAAADAKRYDAAKTHAADAIAAAERAISDGKSGVVRVRDEAASVVSGLKTEIEDTSRNVNGARYSLLDLDYDALDKGIVDAYNTSDQAEVDQALGRYQDALNKAMVVRSDLSDINNKIANAVVRKKG